jgi:hypothetical protein
MFDAPVFLLVHVVLSVLGILTGLVVAGGLTAGARLSGWTVFFLTTTILTNVTGFLFFPLKVSPPHLVGVLSLIVLAVCLVARYGKNMEGRWRAIYVVTAMIALYLNVFVLIVQLFVKTPSLALLAPLQKEPPFTATQFLILALFVWLGISAVRGFKTEKSVG